MLQAMGKAKEFFLDQLSKKSDLTNSTPSSFTSDHQITPLVDYAIKSESDVNGKIFQKSVHIYSHLDADGLSAAAIMAKTLQRAKIGFQITILRQLETDYILEIQVEVQKYNHFIIFTDFGTGQIDLLCKNLNENDFLVLDHHSPQNKELKASTNHVNPYFFGIDGSYEISGAGVSYYFAKVMDPANIDLSSIALIGAIGDVQAKGEKGTFLGTNLKILEEAMEAGKIESFTDIAISRSRPLIQALAYTFPISIPDLSNNETKAREILEKNGIKPVTELNEFRTVQDLTVNEKMSLNKAIVNFAIMEKGMKADIAKKLTTTIYSIKDVNPKTGLTDIREMSSLLNACGRTGHPSLGIGVLLGDPQALQEAIEENRNYRKTIATSIDWAQEHLNEMENIVFFYGGQVIDEKIIGTIASMLIRDEKKFFKPIIAYTESDPPGTYKVSGRASDLMIKQGIDLSSIMRDVCQKMNVENSAGGHPPAAGAKIPSNRLKEFLDLVNEAVKKQLKK